VLALGRLNSTIKTVHAVIVNMALLRPAVQSSIPPYSIYTASLVVDGDLATETCTYTSAEPWVSVDLGLPMDVGRVCVTNDHNTITG